MQLERVLWAQPHQDPRDPAHAGGQQTSGHNTPKKATDPLPPPRVGKPHLSGKGF